MRLHVFPQGGRGSRSLGEGPCFPFTIHPNPTWVPSLSTPVQSACYIFRTYPGEGGGDAPFVYVTDLSILVSEWIEQIPQSQDNFPNHVETGPFWPVDWICLQGSPAVAERGAQQSETLDLAAPSSANMPSC
ncbi:unnamed protein product [Pipistrellus nathusii]|uniref:Uncharacterized protein n=1 Tax=Pipistrellus nathusii TaxID=59473 RepID=A0ABP0A4Y1_PIPNA